jgi:hypothetical protein
MARIRTVKPEFWTDGRMVKLSAFARLLYVGSWNFALCDAGHLPDDPMGLKLKVLPADDVDAEALFEELLGLGRFVRKATPDGRTYLHIPRLSDHQKVDGRWNSRCPFCAAEAETPPTGARIQSDHQDSREPHRTSRDLTEPHASSGEAHRNSAELAGTHRNSPQEGKGKESKGSKYSSSPASPPRDTEPADADDALADEDPGEIPGLSPSPFLPKKPTPGSDEDPDWVKFWELWPKKVSKSAARKAWANAVKKVAPFVVLAGAERYRDLVARENRNPSYIKDPSGWLNGKRWTDEIPADSANASGAGTGTEGIRGIRGYGIGADTSKTTDRKIII